MVGWFRCDWLDDTGTTRSFNFEMNGELNPFAYAKSYIRYTYGVMKPCILSVIDIKVLHGAKNL